MTLTDEERDRLADVVALQPTKNGELADCWGMDSGSEVHSYLEDHLADYYYRDENSLIRATAAAADLVDVEPGVEGDVVRVPPLAARVVEALPGPDEEPASVVATLHAVWDRGVDTDVDAVRSALWSLRDKGVVEVRQGVVPTFRLERARDELSVEELDENEATDCDGRGDADDREGEVLDRIEGT